MEAQYLFKCSCLCVLAIVVWGKPLTLSSVQKVSLKKSLTLSLPGVTSHKSSLPLPAKHNVDNIFSRVVVSNTPDNHLDYKTYSGIKTLSSSSGAKQSDLLSPSLFNSMPHPITLTHDNKITKSDSLLHQKNNQVSDLKNVELTNPGMQQRNFKNADVNSGTLSSDIHMPQSDIAGQLHFTHKNTGEIGKSILSYRTKRTNGDKGYQEFSMADNNFPSVQLALKNSEADQDGSEKSISDTIITFTTAIAVLFSVAVIIGIFGCCCKKKQRSDVNDNADKNGTEVEKMIKDPEKNNTHLEPIGDQEVINISDIPVGEQDLDDTTSVKDKIKAFDNSKLVIQPSPDPAIKRKSQTDLLQVENRISKVLPAPVDDTVAMRDKTDQPKSRSLGDVISKSDTQDDVSDKIFDTVSMESSTISQPNNPDVVIADTDEEDEFAEIQRGTTILKSFQRAKPPRNRSPATRTSKGKIRKTRPVKDSSNERGKSPVRPKSREPSKDREPVSTPSSILVPFSPGVSSRTNSADKHHSMSISLSDSLEKQNKEGLANTTNIMERSVDSIMMKSSEFNDFDSVMSKSVTSIGSDTHKKNESPHSARNKKLKESPKGSQTGRTDSPVRSSKGPDIDPTGDKEARNESPNRYRKNKESPHGRRKQRRADRGNHVKKDEGLSTDINEGQEVMDTSVANRLSGLPPNVNNIFYLIDPTVKNKCKSVGDMTEDDNKQTNRKSGDYTKQPKKVKRKEDQGEMSKEKEDSVSPVKRERTQSDPSRKSKLVEEAHL